MRAAFFSIAVAVVGGLGVLAEATSSQAGTIITPSGLDSTEGNTAGNFTNGASTGLRVLFDISSADFGSLSPGDQLTGIAFRVDTNLCGPCGAFGPTTLHNVTIELATTAISPATTDTTFADYLTTNLQTALSGDVTVSSAGDVSTTGPQAFDIIFNFTTPYTYDPTSGNLVLDIIINSADGIPDFVDAQASPADMSEYFGCVTCQNTTTGNANSNVDIVEFLTAARPTQEVPEPSALFVFASALGGLIALASRARRQTPDSAGSAA